MTRRELDYDHASERNIYKRVTDLQRRLEDVERRFPSNLFPRGVTGMRPPGDVNVESGYDYMINGGTTAFSRAVGAYYNFPGLRGLWRAGNRDSNGDLYDLSGQGRTLTDNNTAITRSITSTLIADDFNGTNEYYDRADEAGLSITGTESHMEADLRGLCLGCWCYPDVQPGKDVGLIGKWVTGSNDRSYLLYINSSDTFSVAISNAGTTNDANVSWTETVPATPDRWWFVCGDYDPDTSGYLRLYVGDSLGNFGYVEDTSSIPASIYDSAAAFEVGRYNANNTQAYDGKGAVWWIAAGLAGYSLVKTVWEQTRSFYPKN